MSNNFDCNHNFTLLIAKATKSSHTPQINQNNGIFDNSQSKPLDDNHNHTLDSKTVTELSNALRKRSQLFINSPTHSTKSQKTIQNNNYNFYKHKELNSTDKYIMVDQLGTPDNNENKILLQMQPQIIIQHVTTRISLLISI
jgi:hypothetical protein